MTDAPGSSTYKQTNQTVGTQYNAGRDLYVSQPPPTPPRRFANVPPAPTETLVGRDELLAELVQGLAAGHARAHSTDGPGGASSPDR